MNLKELMAKHKAKQAEPIKIAPSIMDTLNALSSHPVSEPASHGVAVSDQNTDQTKIVHLESTGSPLAEVVGTYVEEQVSEKLLLN
jgi:hypothetical protein